LKNLFAHAAAYAVALIGSTTALAHDPGLSSAKIALSGDRVSVVLTFNARDIANVAGVPPVTGRAGDANPAPPFRDLLSRAVLVEFDGNPVAPSRSSAITDANTNVEFQFTFSRPETAHNPVFHSLLLKDLPFGHREVFSVSDEHGREISRELLSAQNDTAHFALQASAERRPGANGFLDFLRVGIGHILTGYDHLLFLFGLLVMCRSFRTAALFITCFTIAHSLTLALSTFGLVNLPSRFVEAAIAASILYVGLENLFRRDQPIRGRALLTFAFGLVHGLGFASVLREMGIANSGAAAIIPLVGFNSGVELGQLSVAAIILPAAWTLRRNSSLLRVGLPACSVGVALAGGYWLLERTLF